MAFNLQTFRTRTLTAIIFVIIMLAGLLINRWTFFILISIIHFGCWWEYLKLVEEIQRRTINKIIKFGLMLIGYALVISFFDPVSDLTGYEFQEFTLMSVPVVGLIALFLLLAFRKRLGMRVIGSAAFGLLYVSVSLALMMSLSLYGAGYWNKPPKFMYLLQAIPFAIIVIACMWINDTMAYIIGSLIGKSPLSSISPKKTWEGTIGGLILCTLVVGLLLQFAINFSGKGNIPSYHYYIIPAIAAIAGIIGDLFESKLKRLAGVKDSGHIMPGHGGFLDRFDSLLIATPFVWAYIYFFMN